MTVSTGPLKLGGNAIWGEWFAGLMDDVRVYNRALTRVRAPERHDRAGGSAIVRGMSSSQPRSVKISDNERGGWSSDRPRRAGEAERPPRKLDVSVRGRVLSPSDRMRYSPGQPGADRVRGPRAARPLHRARDRRAERGPVGGQGARAARGQGPGRPARGEGAGAAGRGRAQALRRRPDGRDPAREGSTPTSASATCGSPPRIGGRAISCSSRWPRTRSLTRTRDSLGELRTALNAGELGQEGFMTSLRLGGHVIEELKKIVFAPPPPTTRTVDPSTRLSGGLRLTLTAGSPHTEELGERRVA